MPGDAEFTTLVAELADCLLAKDWTLATAESCTGGWIAKCCTDLAGSSAWFERGFVTYSNEAKQELLGVALEELESEGAVSDGGGPEYGPGRTKSGWRQCGTGGDRHCRPERRYGGQTRGHGLVCLVGGWPGDPQ